MTQVFHEIEKKIINALKENNELAPDELGSITKLSPDQIRRGIEWLKLKLIVTVNEKPWKIFISLGKNGRLANTKGLPERQLLNLLKNGPRPLEELQKELRFIFGPAIGIARKNNWISSENDIISLNSDVKRLPEEIILEQIGNGKISSSEITDSTSLESLKKILWLHQVFFLQDV